MTPLLEYLTNGTLLAETEKAWAIKIKSRQYAVIGGVLYRKSFIEPWLWFVGPLQAKYVVREIHEGYCSMHSGPRFASFKHPETNRLVERENRSLGEGIKASNGDTPFSLTYGIEVVLLVEIGMPSLRCVEVDQVLNNEALLLNLDILEEKRERAAIRKAKSKAKMKKYYNIKVRGTTFKPGDFVYRSNEANHAKEGRKLGPKWKDRTKWSKH
ncbi:hypothetical protein Tco_1577873 [Tanacetum coccineum]